MSINGMREAWVSVEGQARLFHNLSEGFLVEGQAMEGFPGDLVDVLDPLLASSERLRRRGDSALREGEDYELVSTLMLGAASVDAMIARDLATLDPDVNPDRYEPWFVEQGGDPERLVEDADPRTIFEDGEELLSEVGELFGSAPQRALGRSPFPDRLTLVSETEAEIKRLIDLAAQPATDFARGLVTVAFAASGELLSALMHLDVVSELERRGRGLNKHALRFLREHVAKVATLRSDHRIVDELATKIREETTETIGEEIEEHAKGPAASLLRFVSAPAAAAAHAAQRVSHAPEITQDQGDGLLAELTTLRVMYDEQMRWVGKSALWLRRGARLLVHLGAVAVGPLSYAIGAGVFFVGFGYIGYSLADRIDARDLGVADRIEGVVRLVDRQIPS
jgi:hypothetical protein